MVPDPVSVSDRGSNLLYAVTASGEWWFASSPTNWRKVDAPPVVSVTPALMSNVPAYGLTAAGDVYYFAYAGSNPTFTTVHMTGVTGVTQVLDRGTSGDRVYALTADGGLYSAPSGGPQPFTPVMTTGTPSVPLTGVTVMPEKDGESDVSMPFNVVADGKVYRISGSQATPVTGPTDVKDLGQRGVYVHVIDADGSLWSGTTSAGSPLVRDTSGLLPPLESVISRGEDGLVVKAVDGSVYPVNFTTTAPISVRTVENWTPTEFSADDIVQVTHSGESGLADAIVRLANGDVWARRRTDGAWAKLSAPSSVLDISSIGGSYFSLVLSGDVACS